MPSPGIDLGLHGAEGGHRRSPCLTSGLLPAMVLPLVGTCPQVLPSCLGSEIKPRVTSFLVHLELHLWHPFTKKKKKKKKLM